MSSRAHPLSPLEQHQIFLRTFGRLDPIALGTALALTISLAFTAATTIAILQDASDLKQQLDLLGNYFPGFETTPPRSLLSIPYGAIAGFFLGFSFATARNIAIRAVLNFVKLSNFTSAIEQALDD
jgi:hypothetical protein